MTSEVCNLPYYYGLGNVETFLNNYGGRVPEDQILLALETTL